MKFVDTSVLCNLLPVPGRDEHREKAQAELKELQHAKCSLILPMTAIVETGNFITKVGGNQRRATAEVFEKLVKLIAAQATPWRLHEFRWGGEFLDVLLSGAATGMTFVDLMTAKVGGGDMCILTEREAYRRRTGLTDVEIWSYDDELSAHS